VRLWTGSKRPWGGITDYANWWRYFVDVDGPHEPGWLLTVDFGSEAEVKETLEVRYLYSGGSFGAQWCFDFGYTCIQYDGFWKRISFGPLFVSWYSMVGDETDDDCD
jgi:hypothetical protein